MNPDAVVIIEAGEYALQGEPSRMNTRTEVPF